jgi:hypothetical protein
LTAKVISLQIKPGIQRDGTLFDAPSYVDGRWVRFQRGRPRKMQGYRGIFLDASGISRGMIMNSQNGLNYIYSGWSDGLQLWQTDNDDGVGSGPTNISLTNFTANANNLWQFDIGYDVGGGAAYLIAHPGQNLSYIDSTVNTPVLYGSFPGGAMAELTDTQGSTPTGDPIEVSGGCVMLHPYLFVYGNNGFIKNCSAGNFFDWNSADANETNVATGKIVKGLPVRGGTTAPSGLFWSTDSLIRVSYTPTTITGSTLYWRYDIISSQSSIMSSSCVIEYDGIYYWVGVDRFLMYNGVVTEIPNVMNFNYFFDNVNYAQRQKVWVSKVPRWGEIWWFFPSGDSTECNDAVVFNVRDQVWYDAGTAIGARRSAGVFSEVFRKPVWAGNEENENGNYTLWQHETGTDEIYLKNVNAIQSYFETNSIGWVNGGPGSNDPSGPNRWIHLERVEPNFNQSEDMNMFITGPSYAQGSDDTSDAYVFSPDTLKIDLREQRREMRIRFESNTVRGNYEMGQILLSADFGDERGTGNP